MGKDYSRLYFEAVKKILDGSPVKNFDVIEESFEKDCLEALGGKDRFPPSVEGILLPFIADAENQILDGVIPIKLYEDFFGRNYEEERRRGIHLLTREVENYLRKIN